MGKEAGGKRRRGYCGYLGRFTGVSVVRAVGGWGGFFGGGGDGCGRIGGR
jgi:hypothetical protein